MLTWMETLHNIVTHGCEMGWADRGSDADGNRRVWQASRKPHPEWPPRRESEPFQGISDQTYNPRRKDQALTLRGTQAMLHGQSTNGIGKLVELLEGKTTDQRETPVTVPQRETPVTVPPQEGKRHPFAALRGELKDFKN